MDGVRMAEWTDPFIRRHRFPIPMDDGRWTDLSVPDGRLAFVQISIPFRWICRFLIPIDAPLSLQRHWAELTSGMV